jgi:branched chain amino acid efflux pump
MPLLAVAVLAAVTYAFRVAGPLLRDRVTVPPAAQRLLSSAAAVLLVSLAATSALTTGHGFAGWARPTGVLVAGVLAARRVPFPIVAVAAAAVTALLRLGGLTLFIPNGRWCLPSLLTRAGESGKGRQSAAPPTRPRRACLVGDGETTPAFGIKGTEVTA